MMSFVRVARFCALADESLNCVDGAERTHGTHRTKYLDREHNI